MRRSPLILAAALATASSATVARGDDLPALAPAALPMAIRDGRVAAITVHAVPFEVGSEVLAPRAAAALQQMAAAVAGPCFLTAQAVGHARPGTPGDGDPLAAPALARSRADLVRAALILGGLPPEAVAAVSDYQFTVREPRVTLWLFRVADTAECGQPPQAEVARAPAEKPAAAEPVAVAATPAAGPPVAEAEIRFESGSSFFPLGAEQELKRLVAALPAAPGYRFDVRAGVDDAAVKPGDADLSARYNRWLAERRLERVGAWLEQHAEVRELELRPVVAEADRSPWVAIQAIRHP